MCPCIIQLCQQIFKQSSLVYRSTLMQLVLQALNIDCLLFIVNPDNTKKAQVFKEGIDYSVISSMCVCMCVCVCVCERERERE